MRLAVIPARGGSKRIPRKNVRSFCGKPIIAWPLEAAMASGCFDKIIVSTDDLEIAEVARAHGAAVPFIRPADLSDDHTPTIPVVSHAIRWFQDRGEMPAEVCCIYATSPFIRADDILKGLEVMQADGSDYAISVTQYAFPIQRALRITERGRIQMFQPEHFNTRSQDLSPAYHDAAQFYWGRCSSWLAGKPFFSADSVPIVLPRQRVQDIDTPDDWHQAEIMFRVMRDAG